MTRAADGSILRGPRSNAERRLQRSLKRRCRRPKVRERGAARPTRSWRAQRASAGGRAAGGQAVQLHRDESRSRTNCSSWRATARAAAPSRGATGGFRRFCRCAESRSTPKKSAWIRCWPTRNSAPSSRRWAPGIDENFHAGRAQIQQGHHPGGRGPGRRAHPRHSADLLLPLHEGAHHRGACVHRHAAALQGAKGQQGANTPTTTRSFEELIAQGRPRATPSSATRAWAR